MKRTNLKENPFIPTAVSFEQRITSLLLNGNNNKKHLHKNSNQEIQMWKKEEIISVQKPKWRIQSNLAFVVLKPKKKFIHSVNPMEACSFYIVFRGIYAF